MRNARNIAILIGLALLVTVSMRAGDAAGAVGDAASIAILTLLVVAAAVFYRERQQDLMLMTATDRSLLYGALAGLVVLLAGTDRLSGSGLGVVVLVAGFACVVAALMTVWQRSRAY